MAKKKIKKGKEITIKSNETKVFLGILLLIFGVTIAIAPFVDAQVTRQIGNIFGYSSIFWGFTIIILASRSFFKSEYLKSNKTLLGFLIAAFATSLFFTFWVSAEELNTATNFSSYGGTIGRDLHNMLSGAVGRLIEFLLIILLAITSFSLISGTSLEKITTGFASVFESIANKLNSKKASKSSEDGDIDVIDSTGTSPEDQKDHKLYVGGSKDNQGESIISNYGDKDSKSDDYPDNGKLFEQNNANEAKKPDFIPSNALGAETTESKGTLTAEPKYANWKYPSAEILTEPIIKHQDTGIHKKNAVIIEKTLRSFDIESKVNKITIGPTVVQYALSITVGTKVSRVKNLTNDLALALATSESQIRIEAPIPGTSLIGIEIPNPTPNFVYIKDMILELKRDAEHFELPLILGKNVAGKSIIKDLVKMPHLLVAGATGTGKSVGVNSILTGLLMTKTPDELRLILVDPKMVELAPYNGLPHLLVPVITDMELVLNALQWAVDEMTTRYRILKQIGAKNILEYNRKSDGTSMPYIVIIIDEMADLMLTTGPDVETRILRLTQMARAVGIHMILATQRPDVNVITGRIKANVPGRMAFTVSTQIDSRVIIDQTGAETLIGRGDMLFKSPEINRPLRLQGSFTDTPDTEALVNYLKEQTGEVDYKEEIIKPEPSISGSGASGIGGISEDTLFEQALEVILNTQKGSASMLQRRLKIGYNRAARLIDEFYDLGIVGAQDGSSPRAVLINSKEELLQKLSPAAAPVEDEIDEFDD